MTVGVPAFEIAPALRKRVVVSVVEILNCEPAILLASPTPMRQEQILRNCVGLVPRPGGVFLVAPPYVVMLDGMRGKVRQCRPGRLVEDRERVRIAHIFVRINQAAYQLVVAIGREAV